MRTASILLVDDNPDDVNLTGDFFAEHRNGNPLVVAKVGREALAHFAVGRPLPVPALLNPRLSKVSGIEVLIRLRAHGQTAKPRGGAHGPG